MANCFKDFFINYCRFLSKDLVNFFDPKFGRDAKIIDHLYRVFFLLTHKDTSLEDKRDAVKALESVIGHYLANNSNEDMCSLLKVELNCINKDFDAKYNLLNNINVSFVYFVTAQKDFNKYKTVTNQLLKQGLIEFNNAISHLYSGVLADLTFLETNIKKANSHFYRGALDYYKTIIKDNFGKLDLAQRAQLVSLRIYELNCVGVDVSNATKREKIFNDYRLFVENIFSQAAYANSTLSNNPPV